MSSEYTYHIKKLNTINGIIVPRKFGFLFSEMLIKNGFTAEYVCVMENEDLDDPRFSNSKYSINDELIENPNGYLTNADAEDCFRIISDIHNKVIENRGQILRLNIIVDSE